MLILFKSNTARKRWLLAHIEELASHFNATRALIIFTSIHCDIDLPRQRAEDVWPCPAPARPPLQAWPGPPSDLLVLALLWRPKLSPTRVATRGSRPPSRPPDRRGRSPAKLNPGRCAGLLPRPPPGGFERHPALSGAQCACARRAASANHSIFLHSPGLASLRRSRNRPETSLLGARYRAQPLAWPEVDSPVRVCVCVCLQVRAIVQVEPAASHKQTCWLQAIKWRPASRKGSRTSATCSTDCTGQRCENFPKAKGKRRATRAAQQARAGKLTGRKCALQNTPTP